MKIWIAGLLLATACWAQVPPPPTITPTPPTSVPITITCSQGSAYYTTNGSTPTMASTKYTAPFTVAPGVVVKSICIVHQESTVGTLTASNPPPILARWSVGYTGNTVAIADLQWSGLTHIVNWPTQVQPNSTLDSSQLASSAALIAAAHAAGVKVLLCVIQDFGSSTAFDAAIEGNLSLLVTNIMAVVNQYGYDGVDINWEPFNSTSGGSPTQGANLRALAAALRAALGSRILTVAATKAESTYWGASASWTHFDRVNVMTYDMQWLGNKVLSHNAGLYNPSCGSCSSVAFDMSFFTKAGLPPGRTGIGIPFYGRRYNGGVSASNPALGISEPFQAWSVAPTGGTELFYPAILALSGDVGVTAKYDSGAQAPYLSHPGTPSTAWEVSYDNPQSITAKIAWAKAQGFGGWIIWGMWADLMPSAPRHPLLDAVAAAM